MVGGGSRLLNNWSNINRDNCNSKRLCRVVLGYLDGTGGDYARRIRVFYLIEDRKLKRK